MRKKIFLKGAVASAVTFVFIVLSVSAVANFRTNEIPTYCGMAINSENEKLPTTIDTSGNYDNILTGQTTFMETRVVPIGIQNRGILYVGGSGPGNYTTIQAAVNAAIAGDTIYVYNGIYYEHVTIGKQLNLFGENRNNVIIDGNGTGNVVYVTANGVIIDTFAITRGEYGIYTTSSYNIIANCTVYNTSLYSIYLKSSTSSQVRNCDVHDNSQYGLYLITSTTNTLRNNTMHDNLYNFVVDTSGITPPISHFIQDIDTSNTIEGKPIYFLVGQSNLELNETNTFSYVCLTSCTNITVKNNQNVYGIWLAGTTYSRISNISSHNSKHGIVALVSSNNNIIEDCESYNNSNHGIYIYKSIKHNVTNCNAYDNLGSGFFNSVNSINDNFRNCNAYNNTYGFYLQGSATYNNVTNCNSYNNRNTGIFLTGGSRYYITNCTSYNNQGMGLYLSSSGYNTVTDCTIYNSKYSGITISSSTSTYNIVKNCTIHDNGIANYSGNEFGINIYTSANYNEIFDCDIYNHPGYGISLDSVQYNKIINTDLHHNGQGIYLTSSSNNNLTNCNIYNNIKTPRYSGYGISLVSSSNNNIINNLNEYDNTYGVYLSSSSNNKLISVIAGTDFRISGTTLAHFTHDIDPSNYVKGKRIFYLIGQNNLELNETHNFGYLGLISCTNITAKNADVNGIVVASTTGSQVSNVNTHGNVDGMFIFSSSNNMFLNCSIYDHKNSGIWLSSSSSNTIINCDMDNTTNYGIHIISSLNNNFTDCNVNNAYWGIDLDSASNSNIFTNCEVTNIPGYWAVSIPSKNNKFIGCNIYNNIWSGVYISSSNAQNNIINDCRIYNNSRGIYIGGTTLTNNITNCDIYNNTIYGIRLLGASKINIINCDIYNNPQYGIYLESNSINNVIHHNNFINNAIHAYDPYTNQWDDNISAGNYWDNYTGVDADNNGIGDTPYNISGGSNQDRYPLINPLDAIPPVILAVQANPEVQSQTAPVNISCMVTDNWNLVDTVTTHISGPSGFTLDTVMNGNGYYYYTNIYSTIGIYNFYISANDTSENIAVSANYTFVITDFDEPTSSVNSLPEWKNTLPFTITATAYDNTGVTNVTLWYRYSSDGINWMEWTSYGVDPTVPWSWSFTGIDGYYQFYSIAIDNYGNIEDVPSMADTSTGIDTVKPVTTIVPNGIIGENGWFIGTPVTVTLSAFDSLSGIETTWYKLDSGFWTLYSTPFLVNGEGIHTIQYYSFDQAGNQEVTKSASINIDTIAPTTSHTLQGLLNSQGWYVSNVTITLSPNDTTSGINYTMYKLNTGDWIVYTEPIIVTEDGEHTLYYYSVDLAGNTETIQQATFKIEHDITPPVTTYEFDGTTGQNNWFISAVTVTLAATDDSAGVNYTKYKLDTADWTTYTEVFLVPEDGVHILYYYSVDKVGNKEEDKSVEIKIDSTAPSINLTVEKTGLMEWLLTATVSDATSGIAKVEFFIDNDYIGEVTEAPYEFGYSGKDGIAQAMVYDNAGNSKQSDPIPVSVDLDVSSQEVTKNQVVSGNQSQNTIVIGSQSLRIYSVLQRLLNL